jgi:NTE family protein
MNPLRILLLVTALLASGCSTYRPWQNTTPAMPSPPYVVSPGEGRSLVLGVTLSGGGTRAAAFGLGVLAELKRTRITWDGRDTTLMDEVGFIGGVSGGSVLAAHYAAFGDETFESFERDFLAVHIERRLMRMALVPLRLHRLDSPWYGRSHVLAEDLETLFRGRRLGDAAARPGAPELVITATDLRHGSPFEFAPGVLGSMCIDWRQVPLSFAVASSAAVPLLLSPMTLRNHAGRCGPGMPAPPAPKDTDFRSQLRAATEAGYRDASTHPFVHLVDGGLSDNLGVRGLLDRFVADGSIASGFDGAPEGSIRRLVLVVVNAERDVSEAIERSDRVPTTGQVLDTLVFGAGSRDTQVTLAILRQDVQRWSDELLQLRGRPGSPFSADAELHAIVVSLRDVQDTAVRNALLRLPTSLNLPLDDVRALQRAGAEALRGSAAFSRLLRSLGLTDTGPVLAGQDPVVAGSVPMRSIPGP